MKYISPLLFSLFFLTISTGSFSQINYPGNPPGKAKASLYSKEFFLENDAIKMVFQIKGNQIHPISFIDKTNHHTLKLFPLKWF
jgi:hypothetical protein